VPLAPTAVAMLGSQLNWSKNYNTHSVQRRTQVILGIILVVLLIAGSVHAVGGGHHIPNVISHHLLSFSYLVVLKNQLYFVKNGSGSIT
jgi:hypothetical protein